MMPGLILDLSDRVAWAGHRSLHRDARENIYVVLILQGRRGLLLELQQARTRDAAARGLRCGPGDVGSLDILINNAGIGTASPRQTCAEGFETEPGPLKIFAPSWRTWPRARCGQRMRSSRTRACPREGGAALLPGAARSRVRTENGRGALRLS